MKILFVSYNAAIWLHAAAENRLVRSLVKRGHDVSYLSCGRTFRKFCTSMSPAALTPDSPEEQKAAICGSCTHNAELLTKASGARHLILADFVTDEDQAKADELVGQGSIENLLNIEIDGAQIGTAALYEVVLKYKKLSTQFTAQEMEEFKIDLRNCIAATLGFRRVFQQEAPDAVFCYSPQYGVNGACLAYAERQGARTYFIEGSSSNSERYRAVRVWDWSRHGLVNPALEHWDKADEVLSAADVRRLRGHFAELLKGQSFAVYSKGIEKQFDVRAKFGVPSGRKIILLSLSSSDEAYAAFLIGKFPKDKVISDVFVDQFQWVKSTIEFMRGRPDLFCIVRVHPRDFPNKREALESEQAKKWQSIFVDLPKNCVVNYPSDGVSLYNLLGSVDALATGWSATGVEAMIAGVPVVTYDSRLPSYPADIHFTGRSREEYFRNLSAAVARGRGADIAVHGLRWLAYSFSRGVVRIPKPFVIYSSFVDLVKSQGLRNFLNRELTRRDAAIGFSRRDEEHRFIDLVERGLGSLYEVTPPSSAAPTARRLLRTAILQEHAWFRRMITGSRKSLPLGGGQ